MQLDNAVSLKKKKGKAWNRNSLAWRVCWTNTERRQGGKSLLHAEGKRGITYEWLHAWLPDSMNESPRRRLCGSNEHRNCSDFHLQSLIINIVYSTRQGRKHSQTWLMCFISRAGYVGSLGRSPLWDELWAHSPFCSSSANISSQAGAHCLAGCITYTFTKNNSAVGGKLYYELSLILQTFKIQGYFLIT